MQLSTVGYNAILLVTVPVLLLRHVWRSRHWPSRVRTGEVFGWAPLPKRAEIWIHAVSVGEVLAAEPLIHQLLNGGRTKILVTTTTPTGAAMLKERLGELVTHRFMPLDLLWLQQRFLAALKPRCIIVMETEIWPNMLKAAYEVEIPVILANARLSERSTRRYRWVSALITKSLNQFHWIACRSPLDRDRFVSLGAHGNRVTANGDIKFDIAVSDEDATVVSSLKNALGQRPVVILASTHEGEEASLIDSLELLKEDFPNLLTIIAPRHPQRFESVAKLLDRCELPFARRSDCLPEANTRYWLLDTIGELKRFYGLANVAFVGGSLVPVGGHNPLESALWQCPVVTGPHLENFEAMAKAMQRAGLLTCADDSNRVGRALRSWLKADDASRANLGAEMSAFVKQNQGATARIVKVILECSGS